MVSTFVVRLVTDALSRGEFVGRIEHVDSGRAATVHAPEELAAFARRVEAGDPEPEAEE